MTNDLVYQHNSGPSPDWLHEYEATAVGTYVFMLLDLSTTRTTLEVFNAFAESAETFEFDKTIVPVRLARLGNENLISRSQAKRLIARFDRFRLVILDFQGVSEVGQGFADEVFRVFARSHPDVSLQYVNAAPGVAQMIRRVTSLTQGAGA